MSCKLRAALLAWLTMPPRYKPIIVQNHRIY